MQGRIRRVITGHDAQGKAIVISDGPAPAVRTNPLRPGHVSTDLWKTGAAPVVVKANMEDPTGGPKQIHPPPGGTVFRISVTLRPRFLRPFRVTSGPPPLRCI